MRGPLEVILSDGTTAWHITKHVTSPRFKRSAFGGDVDLTCTVNLPLTTFPDLGPTWKLWLVDARTFGTVFEGDLTNPGYTDGVTGQSFDVQAMGGMSRLQAASMALRYVDQTLEEWTRSGNSTKRADTSQDEKGEDNPTLEIAASQGQPIDADWQGEWIDRACKHAGLRIARLRVDYDSGITTPNYDLSLRTGTDNDHLPVRDTANASTSGGTLRATRDGSIDPGDNVAAIRAARNGSGTTPTKDHWFRFANVTIRQVLKRVDGTNIVSGYTDNTILASEAIADMLGRGMAPGIDPTMVTIAETSYEIDQLAWLDGITMGDALQALLVFERDLFWTAYGDTFTAGLWDDENPRYTFSARDGGITLPGQDFALCNRVSVTWTDRKKKEHTDTVTVALPGIPEPYTDEWNALPLAQRYLRDAEAITLPPGTGSAANAQRAGERALAITNNPPRAGTALIIRPVMDLWQGRLVWPHEVMPGCVATERETGHSFRITETEYSDQDAAVTVTLGEPVRTTEQYMSRLARKQRRRG